MSDYDEMDSQIIETVDENGNVILFELVEILELDEKEYGILLPVNEEGKPNPSEDENEVIAMRLIKNGDEYVFEYIEDDIEFQKIVDYVDSLAESEEES